MISQLLAMGLWWQLSRSVDNQLGGMKRWIWIAVPGELQDLVIWGMLVECCLDQQLLFISFSELLIRVLTCWWRCSFCCQQIECSDIFWEGKRRHFLSKLVSGVLFRPRMTFHTSQPSAFDIALCKRSLQLLALVLLIVMFADKHKSILASFDL